MEPTTKEEKVDPRDQVSFAIWKKIARYMCSDKNVLLKHVLSAHALMKRPGSYFELKKISIASASTSAPKVTITLNDSKFFQFVFLSKLTETLEILRLFITGKCKLHVEIDHAFPEDVWMDTLFSFDFFSLLKEKGETSLTVVDSVIGENIITKSLRYPCSDLTFDRCNAVNHEAIKIRPICSSLSILHCPISLIDSLFSKWISTFEPIKYLKIHAIDNSNFHKLWPRVLHCGRVRDRLKNTIFTLSIHHEVQQMILLARVLWKGGYIATEQHHKLYDEITCQMRKCARFRGVTIVYCSLPRSIEIVKDSYPVHRSGMSSCFMSRRNSEDDEYAEDSSVLSSASSAASIQEIDETSI